MGKSVMETGHENVAALGLFKVRHKCGKCGNYAAAPHPTLWVGCGELSAAVNMVRQPEAIERIKA